MTSRVYCPGDGSEMATILIVDDAQTDRELLGKVVSSAGHKAVYATDGDEAGDKAKANMPALIFMDVVMPGTNGFSACRKLKQDPATSKIPVVLVTSKGAESDKFWGQKQGADDHIVKPFSPDTVLSAIRRYVG
jgi:twitching motility two-component system response regulator PilH